MRVWSEEYSHVFLLTFRRCAVFPRFLLTFQRCAIGPGPSVGPVPAFSFPADFSHLPKVCVFPAFFAHLPKVRNRSGPSVAPVPAFSSPAASSHLPKVCSFSVFSAHLPKVCNRLKSSVSQRTFRPLTSSEGVGRGVPRHSPASSGWLRAVCGVRGLRQGRRRMRELKRKRGRGRRRMRERGRKRRRKRRRRRGGGVRLLVPLVDAGWRTRGTGCWISPESYWFFLSMP